MILNLEENYENVYLLQDKESFTIDMLTKYGLCLQQFSKFKLVKMLNIRQLKL